MNKTISAINIADYLTIKPYNASVSEALTTVSKIVELPVPGYTISLACVVYLTAGVYEVALSLPNGAVATRVLWEGMERPREMIGGWLVTLPGNNRREFGNLLQVEWYLPTHGNRVVNPLDWSISHKEQSNAPTPNINLYTIRFTVAENKPITIGNVRRLA